jgi:hypothetical protein
VGGFVAAVALQPVAFCWAVGCAHPRPLVLVRCRRQRRGLPAGLSVTLVNLRHRGQTLVKFGQTSVKPRPQADGAFMNYRGGIYTPSSSCMSTPVNHAMVIVGYDTRDAANPVWIVQNSVRGH